MAYYKKIAGDRIYLSPLDTEDYRKYTKWLNDPAVTDGIGATARITTEESEKEWLNRSTRGGECVFAIIRQENNELLGNCGLHDINHRSRSATCGIFIGEAENRGKGYGGEALRLLLRYSFDTLNLNNIMLKVFSFNKQAIGCYGKVGFKVIGERRQACFINGEYHNDVFMDILASEFDRS